MIANDSQNTAEQSENNISNNLSNTDQKEKKQESMDEDVYNMKELMLIDETGKRSDERRDR